ncbi:MAG: serpin family protein [Candidatus Woesearchaeota archaeon]
MKTKIMIVMLVLSALLLGCTPQPSQTIAEETGATPEGVNEVVNANNQLAFDLYSKLSKDENLFVSPWSILTALSMTCEGARGKTADEMKSVLHLPDSAARLGSIAKIYNELNQKGKKYMLYTANALWAQKDFSFLQEYFEKVEKYYGGKATNLDFVSKTEESRKTINDWVESMTNSKIKDLFPAGTITADTRLVLTNAIYFKGTWVKQFDKENTMEQDFWVTPERKVSAEMMSLRKEKFNYFENENLQILEMPYSGEDLSMLILLPKQKNINGLEQSISAAKLSEWRSQMSKQEVDVFLPKFTFKKKYFLKDTLAEMGMPTAFTDNADFSGMDGRKDLFISIVVHEAFVKVDEEGTEAAAATGVAMELTAAMEKNIFYANHPFMFLIQQKDTGNILFLGKVVNPTE